MARGKNYSDSQAAYTEKKNFTIQNDVRNPKQPSLEKHTINFVVKNLRSTHRAPMLTRRPESFRGIGARIKFKDTVNNYETAYNTKLCNVSKIEVFFQLLSDLKNTNSLLYLRDDSRQHLLYRFKQPLSLEIYLYKLFYPSTFDFKTTEDGDIEFYDKYIAENFDEIFQNICLLLEAIIYDSNLIAFYNTCFSHITSLKELGTVNCKDDVATLKNHLENIYKTYEEKIEARIRVLKKFIPSTVFLSKHCAYVDKRKRKDDSQHNKNVITILKKHTFLAGDRAAKSRSALIKSYKECIEILNDDSLPFERLLNLYCINKKSNLFDIAILNKNRDFYPYLMDGIITKFYINKMIHENCFDISNDMDKILEEYNGINKKYEENLKKIKNKIKEIRNRINETKKRLEGTTKFFKIKELNDELEAAKTEKTEILKNAKFVLTSLHGDPDFIIDNITSRDYEMLDFLLKRSASIIQTYYLKTKNNHDISPTKLCEEINFLNTDIYYKKFSDIVTCVDIEKINKVDYDEIIFFNQRLE